jgi:hypothetical protein
LESLFPKALAKIGPKVGSSGSRVRILLWMIGDSGYKGKAWRVFKNWIGGSSVITVLLGGAVPPSIGLSFWDKESAAAF